MLRPEKVQLMYRKCLLYLEFYPQAPWVSSPRAKNLWSKIWALYFLSSIFRSIPVVSIALSFEHVAVETGWGEPGG